MIDKAYHDTRFVVDKKRDILWKVLAKYLQNKFFRDLGVILDFGSGYCNFINNVNSDKKYAIDLWEGIRAFAAPDVTCLTNGIDDLGIFKDQVDVIFASNVLEHLDYESVVRFIMNAKQALSKKGKLIILQPNYKYSYRHYFDDYTHKSIWTDVSLSDLLGAHGLKKLEVIPKFLPLTLKSKLPVIPSLIHLYLRSPFKPLAGQMLLVFEKVE